MRHYEFIIEGRGIAAREPGEVFIKTEDDFITLQQVVYLPSNMDSYESHEELLKAVDQWRSEFDGTLEIFGSPNTGTKAVMISIWKNAQGQNVAYGKWLKKVNPGLLGGNWSNTDFAKSTGYKTQSKRTETQQIPIKPSDLVPADQIQSADVIGILRGNLEKADVPQEIKSQMVEMITNAINGDKTPIPGAAEYQNLHQVYTAEFAAPLVYINGSPLLKGDMQAVDNMLANIGVSRSEFNRVLWPDNPIEKLVDSYIFTDNYRLGISSKSKSGGGAGASIDGIFNVITRKKDKIPPEFLEKHQDVLDLLTLLMKNNSTMGILKVAKKLELVNTSQQREILDRMQSFDNDTSTLSADNAELLQKSQARYKPQTAHRNYNVGFHLMAVLARYIADHLKTMDIDSFFKGVLSYADMIQIYARVAKRGEDAFFDEFIVKYPPEFDGTIEIDPDTNYFASSKPKGKITFKLRNKK